MRVAVWWCNALVKVCNVPVELLSNASFEAVEALLASALFDDVETLESLSNKLFPVPDIRVMILKQAAASVWSNQLVWLACMQLRNWMSNQQLKERFSFDRDLYAFAWALFDEWTSFFTLCCWPRLCVQLVTFWCHHSCLTTVWRQTLCRLWKDASWCWCVRSSSLCVLFFYVCRASTDTVTKFKVDIYKTQTKS